MKFLKHPLIVACIVTVLVFVSCFLIALNVLRHIDLGMPFDNTYMLTGDIARTSTEALVGVSLIGGRDFYHYYSVTPGESHDLMRFTVPPSIVDKIRANPAILCFGTQLQPQADENVISFMTPVIPYKSLTPSVSTPLPAPDYSWLTPSSRHTYMGASCTTRKTGRSPTYYKIRVDESNQQMWIVWLEVYSG